MADRIIHVIAPYLGDSPLRERQELFLESIDRAHRSNVVLVAVTEGKWNRPGWSVLPAARDAHAVGDQSDKPFLSDLYQKALRLAEPNDWILYTNVDCAFAPDLYQHLLGLRGAMVEYCRQNVENNPTTLKELFENVRTPFDIGIDGMAFRAWYYRQIQHLLPDFVIGEPHWDTVYSGMVRAWIPVLRDRERLFHPRHPQAWSVEHPSPAGQYNEHLYADAQRAGAVDHRIRPEPDVTDTAIILTAFGRAPERVAANCEGIRQQLQQHLYCDFYLVEMVNPGEPTAYPADLLARVRHVLLEGGNETQDLFQKEALNNVGWRHALDHHPYEYFIFVDADVYSEQRDWFHQIRSRLQENPARGVHGFRFMRDTIDPELKYQSLGSTWALGDSPTLNENPGVCWGLHRRALEMADGINPYCFAFNGDAALVSEFLDTAECRFANWIDQHVWWRELSRPLPYRLELDCIAVDILHVHHGYFRERNYDKLAYAFEGFRPVREIVELAPNGLLRWIDPACPERSVVKHPATLTSNEIVDQRFRDAGLARVVRDSPETPYTPSRRDLLPFPGRRKPMSASQTPDPASHRRIRIFEPLAAVDEYHHSWCSGIRQLPDSNLIPVANGEMPLRLVLDVVPGSPYVIAVLPVRSNWYPRDLRSYSTLHLSARLVEPGGELLVQWETETEDGSRPSSASISLSKLGLTQGEWHSFSIPLADFARPGFSVEQTRLLKFVGYGAFHVEMASIYVD